MSICPRCTAEQQLARVKEKDKPTLSLVRRLLFLSLSLSHFMYETQS